MENGGEVGGEHSSRRNSMDTSGTGKAHLLEMAGRDKEPFLDSFSLLLT